MADRRRRRRRASQDSEEEDESASGSESGRSSSASRKPRGRDPEPVEVPVERVATKRDDESECESEDGVGEAVLSDYDSADLEENGSHTEGGEDEEEGEHFSDDEASRPAAEPKPAADAPTEELVEAEEREKVVKEVKTDEKENLAGERQSGDGQESTEDPENKSGSKGQKLDDDEDRKNPAYIPRKGLFFEHDVRGQATEEERPKGRHRKLWKDEGRWEHDKFREEEQAPKSREELIALYGYDIRNGAGQSDGRSYRSRKPRYSGSPSREPRRHRDGEKSLRTTWQGPPPGHRNSPQSVTLQSGPPPAPPAAPKPSGRPSTQPPQRSFQGSRPSSAPHRTEGRGYPKPSLDGPPPRGVRPQPGEGERGPRLRGRGSHAVHPDRSPAVVVEDIRSEEEEEEGEIPTATTTYTAHHYKTERERVPSPRKQDPGQVMDGGNAAGQVRESSPPQERPVEKKSYSLGRRATRTRPSDLSKQASLDDSSPTVQQTPAKSESWQEQSEAGTQGGLTGLDQDLARLSLGGQNWAQSPPSYLQAEMRGIRGSMHMAGGPPQYGNMEDLGVGGGRAKRYSSQRQRPVPEPAPMHIGVMEGHYYEPMSFQGTIYTHGDSPAALPPQGMLVQPEMHLPHPTHPGHPGLHPHPSGGPIPNPALYAAPPVSMSPGQPPPQQLLPPPFYPPPGVMTFGNTNYPYPAGATLPPMYPNPQAQSQVYGGVTYYDTMQQQAQPKRSPPRRSSHPVTVRPPPPEVTAYYIQQGELNQDQSRNPAEEIHS
ncbi:protein CASC3 isoform X1 [Pimephales promelas]|uniref:protein CASC3 isoform X1 n=1 Tax=Pimephales promelas TaxID=90988 RepID=UPI0019557A5A|nr:protein CASC3 isoform X1 [Pimephales promelas]KAG1967366.1 protein CASC3 [Pimephales promelas]